MATPVALSLESPNQTSSLAKVVFAEYFTGELGEVSRLSALQIPALKKARTLLISTIASLPLREYKDGVEVERPWLRNSSSGISPWHRAAGIVDDLLFYDWSLLAVERDKAGQIIDSVRVPFERWSTNSKGQISVDGRFVPANSVVLIPGSGDGGILAAGAATIKGARAVERAWVSRAQAPIPMVELHQLTDDEMEDEEIDELVESWNIARSSATGATGFTDKRIEVRTHGDKSGESHLEESRNAVVLDIARLTGVPASVLDGSQSEASLTYSTSEGNRNDFIDYSLQYLLAPIEARFSLDDVSGAGSVIRFDKTALVTREQAAVTSPLKD
ncbi:phage portal protein [Salinibacterium sp. SWN139]|uniref:phage portal protein n=1 Tax=Salinibacterium sp. SWN139 TaxID=2792055 RepID=UPI0018CE4FFE|nr:phage portal protein [Salinibacterium sp. SWN139]MBH0054479.1 phage portal protein [Salinibacterium sp. SWN139]